MNSNKSYFDQNAWLKIINSTHLKDFDSWYSDVSL